MVNDDGWPLIRGILVSESERDSEMLLCLTAGVQPIRLQKLFYYRHAVLHSRLKTTD